MIYRLDFRPRIVFTLLALCGIALQVSRATNLADSKGTTAPCVGIGPLVGKCIQIAQEAGMIRSEDLGQTGITFSTNGDQDGRIEKVDPASAAAQAGLGVGDAIIEINGKPVKSTPGMLAMQQSFGERGQSVRIKVRRNGAEVEVTLVRDAQNAPPGPDPKSHLIYVRPMVNWKGEFIPCMGAGPAGPAAIEYCHSHFKKDGYIKASDYGSTGFEVDRADLNVAKITMVTPGSAAEKAGLLSGDEILQIDGKPLAESLGEVLPEKFFGKAGDRFQLTVKSGDQTKQVVLVLAAKARG
jgi:C-terminal processing protease CtpA/Prc